ncbi:MAG: aldo/keto reductase [Chloroflexi bacterium CFX7]|nr:MAG: aldo/keto reductase [bacterium]MCE7927625.1 aldo/keto reductase [Chloroflexi bacterium CFX7]MCL4231336.1 aldo/keto reductase [Dehalococcoidia bacterium]RIL03841.1 MAG: aldo/keto reductase [bacterium]
MEHRHLGRSGLQVSVVGLGCNNFGRRIDAVQAKEVVDRALDLGINFFDTANVYGAGQSEEFLGRALEGRRQDVVIATKFGMRMGEKPMESGGSRRHLIASVEASLRRLGTDYIDLLQFHTPDSRTPIEETLRALDDLVREGKVRYIGHSNFAAWQAAEAHFVARAAGLTPFISAQNEYNLLDRRIERELVPACRAYGVSVLPYFPLASGFLTGKYRPGEPPPAGTRLAGAGPLAGRVLNDRNFNTLQRLEAIAAARGRSMLELAIGWLASQPHVASVIAGATKPGQVEENIAAAEWSLSPEELAEVDLATA